MPPPCGPVAAGAGTAGGPAALRWLLVGLLGLRLALLPLGLYRSTDFEVHRNWLAITYTVPVSRWYYEETSPWTLDYPPLFAYFEWLLSQVAALADPLMLEVPRQGYASPTTVAFQRLSVIAGDLVLLAGAWRVGSLRADPAGASGPLAAALVLGNPGLLLVDHVHFQYNGMLLGLLLLSIAEIASGRVYRGTLLFCALLNLKHIFLYVAPVYFVYLLRGTCGACLWPGVRLHFGPLLRLALAVMATFGLIWAPIAYTGQALQAIRRLFPFGRGLTHAYWAPNVWALYNTADRALAKLFPARARGGASTAGMAEVYESSVLWSVPPKATFALTLFAYAPLLAVVWRQTPPGGGQRGEFRKEAPRQGAFALYAALGCAASFAFGWHVHEKAVLMVIVPLLAAAAGSDNTELRGAVAALSAAGTFSLLPLMPQTRLETLVKWSLVPAGHALELWLLRDGGIGGGRGSGGTSLLSMLNFWPLPGWLVLAGLLSLGAYRDFGGHDLLFGPRMEFLPLILVSDVSAGLVLGGFLRLFLLVARARP